jgi:aspartate-semialdehyde dehydrogenase
MTRIGCAIVGATGAVGQRFVERLAAHPQFRIEAVVGASSVGKRYGDAANWILDADVPAAVADKVVTELEALDPRTAPVVFSALPGGDAGPIETRLAQAGHKVFTNAKDHRMDADVPLLIPEINADHLALVESQPTRSGKHGARPGGFIVANGNCSAIVLTLALAPLHRAFGLREVDVTTMQGLSGAGYPGVPGLDILDNVMPFISGEEEKMATEPQKTLGSLDAGGVLAADFTVRATCTRVPVREGHFETVHAVLDAKVTADDVRDALASFAGPPALAALHTAPRQPVHVFDARDRPQPRRDRDLEGGMAISVGRIRVGDGTRHEKSDRVRFVALGHNTVRGAAGQSVLNAEYSVAGFL